MEFRTGYEAYWIKLRGLSEQPAPPRRTVKSLDLRGEEVAKVTIRAAVLKFDIESFTVRPGQAVELTLENADIMPHNLLIVAPGTIEEVAKAALALGVEGWGKHYVPDRPDVLHATKLVDASKQEALKFTAPEQPGDYPYVCTFPGHAYVMRGVMKVAAPE